MKAIRRQYRRVEREIQLDQPLTLKDLKPPVVIIPITGWSKIAQKALQFALEISPDVKVVHVCTEDDTNDLHPRWKELVEIPARKAGYKPPELKVIPSPYRYVLNPILAYIMEEAKKHSDRQIAVIIPEKVEKRWYNFWLHNQRAALLKAMLYFSGNKQIIVMNIPWYLGIRRKHR
jgi:hypothetical protein